jgi:hypothetical protein
MTNRSPLFDDLVGTDLEGSERERLRRVHDLLVAAGPPPDLPAQLEAAPRSAPSAVLRRRRIAVLALAAALGLGVFALGFLAGDRHSGPQGERVVAMSGTPAAPGATASLTVFKGDAAGNWPMTLTVRGLPPTTGSRPYELWLVRKGKLVALCGYFLAETHGPTVVSMNAPYALKQYDGWVVVVEGSKTPLLTT